MAEYLVTGGAGFIGSNLVHALVDDGMDVRVLDNFSTGRRKNLEDLAGRCEVVEGDLRDAETLGSVVQGVRYVFHLGALPSVTRSVKDPAASNEINITGTLNLLLAARDHGVERFVMASSSSVYGDTPVLPKHEEMMPSPLSPYALSKLAGEHYCRLFKDLYGVHTFALRFFNVFGPRQDPSSDYAAVIPKFIDALRKDQPPKIYGDGEQTRDFTFVHDIVGAVRCCCSAGEEAAGSVYNMAWGNRTSINELATRIAKIMGKDIEPIHEELRMGDVRDSQADSSRAREALGWVPQVTFEEGLERTVEWFLAN